MRYFSIINYGDRAHTDKKTLELLVDIFKQHGKEFVFRLSTSIEHSAELVQEAEAKEYDALLIGGGDGTVNAILNLAHDKPFTFGVLPFGTTNALAQTIGMPRNPSKAAEAIINASPRRISVGKVNSHYFSCFASIGFDAATVHNVSMELKLKLSKVAYGLIGLRQAARLNEIAEFEVTCYPPDTCEKGYSLILSNLPIYAGFHMFRALPYRSRMEMYVFKNNRIRDYLKYIAGLAFTRGEVDRLFPDVSRLFIERVHVQSPERLFLQVDGEAYSIGDNTTYEFTVLPKALEILVPPRIR